MTLRLAERIRPVIRFRRVGFEALAVGVGQGAAALGSVVGVRLLTEAMPPSEYGLLALAMTIGTLGLQVLLLPLTTSALRFFAPAQEAGDLRGFLAAVKRLVLASVAIVAALALVTIAVMFAVSQSLWVPLTIASFVFTLFTGVSAVADGLQNAARHRVTSAIHSGLGPWLRFLAAVALMHLTARATSAVAMAGYAAATGVVFVSQMWFVRRQIVSLATGAAVDPKRWQTAMLSYGWPFASWGIFTWAQLASDRWALGTFATAADVGYYAVVYQLGFYPIHMAYSLLGQVLAPILFARAGDGSDAVRVEGAVRLNARLAMVMAALTAAGAALAALMHPLVGRLLLAPEYRGVTHYLPWMVVAGGLYAIGQTVSHFFMISNRSAALAAPKIGTAILGILFSFAGAKWFGIAGVIGALIAFGVVYCLWVTVAAARVPRGSAA